MMRVPDDGACVVCGRAVVATSQAWWDETTKTMWCPTCGADEWPAPLIPVDTAERHEVAGGPVSSGVAGRSAQQKYERLRGNHEKDVRKRHPRIGGFLLAVSEEKQSTKAWATGAEGERRVGAKLDELRSAGVVTLHDRRVSGKRTNIDHIAVAPSGIWVIDTKYYENAEIARKDVGGLFRKDIRLYVRGRDETNLVTGLHEQAEVVRTALAGGWPDLPIHPALCFVDGVWPLLPSPFEVQGVRVFWSKRVAKEVGRQGPISPQMVEHIAARLAERLVPA